MGKLIEALQVGYKAVMEEVETTLLNQVGEVINCIIQQGKMDVLMLGNTSPNGIDLWIH